MDRGLCAGVLPQGIIRASWLTVGARDLRISTRTRAQGGLWHGSGTVLRPSNIYCILRWQCFTYLIIPFNVLVSRWPKNNNNRTFIGAYTTFHMGLRAQDRALCMINPTAQLNFKSTLYEDDVELVIYILNTNVPRYEPRNSLSSVN